MSPLTSLALSRLKEPPEVALRYTLYPTTWLVLAFQFNTTDDELEEGGVGLLPDTPSPERFRVPGDERFALNKVSVPDATPATVGLNHT